MAVRKISETDFPIYQFKNKILFAFMGPKEMYKIENVGSNKMNEGVCIDHYITRKMVLTYLGTEEQDIDWQDFKSIYNRIFEAYRIKIIGV